MESNLDAFWQFLSEYRKLIVAPSGALLGTVGLSLLLGPSPVKEVSAGLALAELALAVTIFFFRRGLHGRRVLVFVALLLTFAVCLIGYAYLLSAYTIKPFEDRPRVTKGYILNDYFKGQLEAHRYRSPEDGLKDNSWDPAKVWTESSIQRINVLIVAAWAGTVLSLAGTLFVFVLSESKNRVTLPEPRQPVDPPPSRQS